MTSLKRPYQEEAFEIEKFLKHDIIKRRYNTRMLQYTIKWVGYGEDENSEEDTWQLESFGFVLEYWNELSLNSNNDLTIDILHWHQILHEWQKEHLFLRSDDFYFVNQIAKWIKKYDWAWQLKEFKESRVYPEIEFLFRQYEGQFNQVASLYENVPFIEVSNIEDNALPIPWNQLIFDIEMPNHTAAAKETTDGYGLVLSPEELQLELKRQRKHLHKKGRTMVIDLETKKDDIQSDEKEFPQGWPFAKSKVDLLLARTVDKYWELQPGNKKIQKDTVIMPLTGELVDVAVAEKTMCKEGEFVAMSGFIQLTKDHCLDRRFRSGLDRFVHHSCDPTCYVDVSWWKGKPVAMIKAKRDIDLKESLSLDYYCGFGIGDAEPLNFYKRMTEHIFCACLSPNCRKYLWIDHFKRRAAKKDKAERLQLRSKPFYGLRVAKIERRQKQPQKKILGNKEQQRIVVENSSDED